jgi:hypothetical protein
LIIEANLYEQKSGDEVTPRFYEEPDSWGRSVMLRFILVNDRTLRADAHCALCCTNITGGYVREIGTKFCYCSRDCFANHSRLEQLVIEHRARAAS